MSVSASLRRLYLPQCRENQLRNSSEGMWHHLITRVIVLHGTLVEHTLEHVLQAGGTLLARDVKVLHGTLKKERGGRKRRWTQGDGY